MGKGKERERELCVRRKRTNTNKRKEKKGGIYCVGAAANIAYRNSGCKRKKTREKRKVHYSSSRILV
jgi:hypothetical protein